MNEKIILGIKDDYGPMRFLGFEGDHSVDIEDYDFIPNYRKSTKRITLETNGDITEFTSFQNAFNCTCGERSGYYLRDLSFLKTEKDKFKISKVISRDPATIVFWEDGTKTVVKCQEGDTYDLEKGILYAVLRKVYGEGRNYTDILNVIDESCENYNHRKANEAFWNYGKEEKNESTNTI